MTHSVQTAEVHYKMLDQIKQSARVASYIGQAMITPTCEDKPAEPAAEFKPSPRVQAKIDKVAEWLNEPNNACASTSTA